jgi:predicted membrane protein
MDHFDSYRRHRTRGEIRFRSNSGAIPGVILVAIGALFFLNNLHIFYIRDIFRFWPAILIAFGIVKLVDSTYSGGRVFGGILAGFGAIFMARSLGYINISMREIWPLFLVGLGLLLLVQRSTEWQTRLPDPGGARPVGAGALKIDAIFGGSKRVVTTQDFKGGEVVAVFGGVEMDLRQAGMTADSAILEINAIFGGVELKIPRNWTAVVQGVGIFGGYADNSFQTDVPGPDAKQLIVRGAAVFGGVDVKN